VRRSEMSGAAVWSSPEATAVMKVSERRVICSRVVSTRRVEAVRPAATRTPSVQMMRAGLPLPARLAMKPAMSAAASVAAGARYSISKRMRWSMAVSVVCGGRMVVGWCSV